MNKKLHQQNVVELETLPKESLTTAQLTKLGTTRMQVTKTFKTKTCSKSGLCKIAVLCDVGQQPHRRRLIRRRRSASCASDRVVPMGCDAHAPGIT